MVEKKTDKYEFLDHTADIKFKIFGKNINDIFENSVLAISEILSRGGHIEREIEKNIEVSAKDYEGLLYSLIDEIVYLLDAENFVVSNAKLNSLKNKKELKHLKMTFYGDDVKHYSDLEPIKAATYAEMYIKEIKKDSWEAQVVVDV